MAFNPNLPLNQVDRGSAPPPGDIQQPRRQKRMVQVRQGDRLWYYDVGSPEANQPGAVAVDVDAVVTHGYSHPAQPAASAPAQSAAPAGGTPPPQPSLGNNPIAPPLAESGGPGAQATDRQGLGPGQWVRIGTGDQVGVDIVQAGSPAAQAAINQGVRPVPVLTGLRTVHGVGLDDHLTTSGMFDAANRSMGNGAQIIAAEAAGVPGENSSELTPGYKVTWRMANGAEQTFTFRRSATGTWAIAGAPETNLQGVTTPEKAALERAQAQYQQAAAAHQQAQTAHTRGQIAKQDLDNAKTAADNAERAWNTAMGRGNVTHDDWVKQQETTARTGLLGAQTQQTEVQTQVAVTGAQNQTYNNVLQYYRDQGHDEAKAVELTLQYFNNLANTNNTNNTLALNAAKAQVDAETAANTQRVSLANNRLSQSNQGFSDDARQAMDLNQYLKPGSEKGVDALRALQAMRYHTAKKYGAFDVNDTDLRYDPSKIPSGIAAFANPSNPSFTSYPTWDEMHAARSGMRAAIMPNERSTPPDHTGRIQVPPKPAGPPPPTPQTPARPAASAAPSAQATPQNPNRPPTPTRVAAIPVTTELPVQAQGPRPTINPITGEPTGLNPLPEEARGPNPAINPITGEPTGLAPLPNRSSTERPDDVLTYIHVNPATGQEERWIVRRDQMQPGMHEQWGTEGWQLERAEPNPERRKPGGDLYQPLPPNEQSHIQFTPDAVARASEPAPMQLDATRYGHISDSPLLMKQGPEHAAPQDGPTGQPNVTMREEEIPFQPNVRMTTETYPSAAPMPNGGQGPYNPGPGRPGHRPGEPTGVYPPTPASIAQMGATSPTVVGANALLAADEEEKRRRRESFMQQWGSPNAIYGLFEGSYPEPSTFLF